MSSCDEELKGLLAIPAYNEEDSIEDVIKEVQHSEVQQDLLIVNDGSSDKTRDIVAHLGIRQAVHPTNLGYGAALQTAIRYAQIHEYDYLVLMDADGQHNPSSVERLAEHLEREDLDMVIGSRFSSHESHNISATRKIGMKVFSYLTELLCGAHVTDTSSGLKAVNARVYTSILQIQFVDYHSELIVYLAKKGFDVDEVTTPMRDRVAGQSMHNWKSLGIYPLKTLLGIVVGMVEAFRESEKDRLEVSK